MTAYYNEIDPFAAAWLRELIAAGLIAPGDVDERSIADVRPDDLAGYRQCHFFAGIGVWSHALRAAGWPDDRPVWTGSCPCPPFSSAGKKKACPSCGGTNPIPSPSRTGEFICCLCGHAWAADDRHLWPEFWRLIRDCRPDRVLGEQVASPDGHIWLDIVRASLEIMDYAAGYADTSSAIHGAPHIRQRLYWTAERLADAERIGWKRGRASEAGGREPFEPAIGPRDAGRLAYHHHEGLEGRGQPGRERAAERPAGAGGVARGVGHTESERTSDERERDGQGSEWSAQQFGALAGTASGTGGGASAPRGGGDAEERIGPAGLERRSDAAGPVNGLWRDADWLLCRDGRWRPVEPGTFPLAHGAAARMGRLRGYGNAINAAQATAFIEAVLEATEAGGRAASAEGEVQLRTAGVT